MNTHWYESCPDADAEMARGHAALLAPSEDKVTCEWCIREMQRMEALP